MNVFIRVRTYTSMYIFMDLWICKLTTTGCGIMLRIHQYCRNHSVLPVVWAAGLKFMIRRKTDTRFPERPTSDHYCQRTRPDLLEPYCTPNRIYHQAVKGRSTTWFVGIWDDGDDGALLICKSELTQTSNSEDGALD